MAAFEFNNDRHRAENLAETRAESPLAIDPRRLREECIIALKVYDSCRQQDCLTHDQLGPARAAECICIGDEHIDEGDIIVPPSNAAAVTIDRLKVRKIIIVEKEPNPFRNGFWDIDIKYVFEYRLTFREADGSAIGTVRANSIFNKKVSLFGSTDTDLVIATDFLAHHGHHGESTTIEGDPFVLVEAKGVALAAEIHRSRHHREDERYDPREVRVTIGLFTIIKIFRIVNLTVESRGFCIPEECEEISPFEPCEFFRNLDFPMDIFAPPQRPEFIAGISGNIRREEEPCGCES